MTYRQKSPWLRNLIILVVIVAVIYFAWGMFAAKPEAPKAPPPPSVTIQQIQISDVPLYFDYAGRLAGSREVEIRPRVGGIIQQRLYTEGQFVKQGTVLFQIDPTPYQAALAQAQATYEQADKDFKRSQGLRKDKALSPREYEQAESLYGQSKAAVETAKINLGWTTVRAPISGYTSEEGFSEGSLVSADTSLLTRLTQLDPMYVEFAYPDTEATAQRVAVAKGMMTIPASKQLSAEIRMDDGSVYPLEGKVSFTDSIIDQTTGTVRARAVVPNAHSSILPGQFVRVVVKGFTQKNTVAVPEQAVMQGPKGTFVYTVDANNKAQITPVTLGLLNRHLQLITDGLKEGDKVIVEGMIKAKPDKEVTIDAGEKKDDAAAPAASDKKPDDAKADDKKDAPPSPATDTKPAPEQKDAPAFTPAKAN